MSLWRVLAITGICGGAAVSIGAVNIWLGILAAPILYGISSALLRE